MTPVEWLAAAAGTFSSQVGKGLTGFGGTLLLVPVLALLWGTHAGVQVGVCCSLVGGLVMLPAVLRQVRFRLVGVIFVPLVVTTWVGTGLVAVMSERAISWVLAVLVAAFGLALMVRPVQAGVGEWTALPTDPGGRRRLFGFASVAGMVSGVLNGLVGASGPPVVVFMRRYFSDAFFRSQLTALFLLSDLTLIGMLSLRGLFDPVSVHRAGLLLVPLLLGNLLGSRIARVVDRATFSRVVALLLLIAAATLVL